MIYIDNQYISASVFYNRSNWHSLITGFIEPQTNLYIKKGLVESVSVYLSTDKGEHIKLWLKCPANNEELIDQFQNDIKRYLEENESFTKPVVYPLKGFFMDYPNNTLVINNKALIPPENFKLENIQRISISITAAITAALGHDEIEMESIYTFIIYLKLGLIKAAWPDTNEACFHTAALIDTLSSNKKDDNTLQDDTKKYDEGFMQVFEYNKDLLNEILNDIWNNNYAVAEMQWMRNWEESCKLVLNTNNFTQAFTLISGLIYKHMGFERNDSLLRPSIQLINNAFKIYNSYSNNLQ